MPQFEQPDNLRNQQRLVDDGDQTRTSVNPQTSFEPEADTEQQGSVIAERFRILEFIAEGGMGRVYKVEQLGTGRIIALKLLPPHLVDETSRARFHQEAKVAAALNDPNTVRIFDFGETGSGQLYLAMELIDGVDFSTYIVRHGCVSPDEAIDICLQICDGLSEAHAAGIVHRDLKPSNVMLIKSKSKKYGVKILDFGIAKLVTDTNQDMRLTRTGQIFGSPLYMSPEQCDGKSATAASDIYAMGCILYEALLGVPPHRGENTMSTMYKHCHEEPLSFKEVRPDLHISTRLEQVVMKCLRKAPAERFASADQLSAELGACRSNSKAPSQRVSKYSSSAMSISKRTIVVASVFLLALATIATSLSWINHIPSNEVVHHPHRIEAVSHVRFSNFYPLGATHEKANLASVEKVAHAQELNDAGQNDEALAAYAMVYKEALPQKDEFAILTIGAPYSKLLKEHGKLEEARRVLEVLTDVQAEDPQYRNHKQDRQADQLWDLYHVLNQLRGRQHSPKEEADLVKEMRDSALEELYLNWQVRRYKPETYWTIVDIIQVCRAAQQYDDALDWFMLGRDWLVRAEVTDNDKRHLSALLDVYEAAMLAEMKRYDKSFVLYERALDVLDKETGPSRLSDYHISLQHRDYSDFIRASGNKSLWDKSRSELEKAIIFAHQGGHRDLEAALKHALQQNYSD